MRESRDDYEVEHRNKKFRWSGGVLFVTVLILVCAPLPHPLKILLTPVPVLCFWYGSRELYRIGVLKGKKLCLKEREDKEKSARSDIWTVMHVTKGIMGNEVVTLKRDPESSPPGVSALRRQNLTRVVVAPSANS